MLSPFRHNAWSGAATRRNETLIHIYIYIYKLMHVVNGGTDSNNQPYTRRWQPEIIGLILN